MSVPLVVDLLVCPGNDFRDAGPRVPLTLPPGLWDNGPCQNVEKPKNRWLPFLVLTVVGMAGCGGGVEDGSFGPDGQPSEDGTCEESSCRGTSGEEVYIPAGVFWMGCNDLVDPDCKDSEKPFHAVYLDGYYIDRTEVTVDAYAACVMAAVCSAPQTGARCNWQQSEAGVRPANCVSWHQAVEYCHWVGRRLPTEAEWEKAARGGCEENGGTTDCEAQSRRFPWGNEAVSCTYAVMESDEDGCGTGRTMDVCTKSPAGDSPCGLCDMIGNVWEFTADWYDTNYYAVSPADNPTGPSDGVSRVIRGGSYMHSNVRFLRVSARSVYSVSGHASDIGFRCARSE